MATTRMKVRSPIIHIHPALYGTLWDSSHAFTARTGALEDMREGFRILRPGGYLLGHDAFPESKPVYHGGMGWNGVIAALRQLSAENGWRRTGAEQDGQCDDAWAVVLQTAYMFAILKA
jgi:hypothetical protein